MVLFCGEIITNLLLELLIIVVTEHWDLMLLFILMLFCFTLLFHCVV